MKNKTIIIGAGFSALSAAAFLAKQGMEVTLLEKNGQAGGRAGVWQQGGFTFDMGPSWYWMPDVFEKFYNHFGYSQTDLYKLTRLSPSYKIFYKDSCDEVIPDNMSELEQLFEQYELGAGTKLRKFLKEAQYKYEVGMQNLVYKPGLSPLELITMQTITGVLRLQIFNSFSKHIRNYFKHPFLLQLLEFPVLFLGAKPANTPALYSLMNYADMQLGTWYPQGGMSQITNAMQMIVEKQGAKIKLNSAVSKINVEKGQVKSVVANAQELTTDYLLAGADYQHVDQTLLLKEYQQYTSEYWDKRVMAPSCLIYYVGVNKKLKNLLHHNLFFDTDFEKHAEEIYDSPIYPSNPLFYVCCPSITDATVAPENCENIFILIPVAAGLPDTDAIKESYFDLTIGRIEKRIGIRFKEDIIVKRSYAHRDFVKDYNSFKGNAYGLANTLLQTAFLRPQIKSKKISNMYYTGQLTVPGPGVPPAIISGEIAANQIIKSFNKN